MNKLKLFGAAVLTTAFMAVSNDNAQAQSMAHNSGDAAYAHVVKQKLNAPVVKAHTGDGAAMFGSAHGNIAVHIYHSKDDPISGYRYANGFANGFATSEKTGGKPIYVTATYEDGLDIEQSYVKIYMNGYAWEFNGNKRLTPQLAGQLLPQVMADYVEDFGSSNLIPEGQTPVMAASVN